MIIGMGITNHCFLQQITMKMIKKQMKYIAISIIEWIREGKSAEKKNLNKNSEKFKY